MNLLGTMDDILSKMAVRDFYFLCQEGDGLNGSMQALAVTKGQVHDTIINCDANFPFAIYTHRGGKLTGPVHTVTPDEQDSINLLGFSLPSLGQNLLKSGEIVVTCNRYIVQYQPETDLEEEPFSRIVYPLGVGLASYHTPSMAPLVSWIEANDLECNLVEAESNLASDDELSSDEDDYEVAST